MLASLDETLKLETYGAVKLPGERDSWTWLNRAALDDRGSSQSKSSGRDGRDRLEKARTGASRQWRRSRESEIQGDAQALSGGH